MDRLITKQVPLESLILKKGKREENIKEYSLDATEE